MDAPAIPRPAVRRFTLLDGMILVAATACGCGVDGWINSLVRSPGIDAMDLLGTMFGARQYPQLAVLVMILIVPVAAGWTLALIPLRLFRPRPSLRRLAHQPGWMASLAFAVAFAFVSAVLGGLIAIIGRNQGVGLLELSPMLLIFFAPVILTAWLSLILTRRWRPEPSWLDRSGRILGVFWILMAIAGPLVLATAFH